MQLRELKGYKSSTILLNAIAETKDFHVILTSKVIHYTIYGTILKN